MKSTLLLSATLATALLSACGDNKTTTEATTASTESTTATMPDSAKMDGKMDGMAAADAAGSAATGSLTGAMAKMMQKMNAGKPIGNMDHDFAHMMMTHHQGAIDMSEVELRDGKDATLSAMAGKIITDQKKEIADLDKVADRLDGGGKNYTPKDPADKFQARLDAGMKTMMQPMTPSGDVNMDYAMMMVAHHRSAVQMAEAEVAMGKDPELKKMAQMMIDAQKKEIQQFNDWMAKTGKMKM